MSTTTVIANVAASATFTLSDKPNEATTITITDFEGTSVVFEVDNEANGAAGTNTALNGIAGAGGGATGTAADLVAKVNASSLRITATNPSTGKVDLSQDAVGVAGNKAITLSNSTNWNSVSTVNVPAAFTGGEGRTGAGANKGSSVAHGGNATGVDSLTLGQVLGAGSEGGTKPAQTAAATETEGAAVASRNGQPGVITAKGSGTFAYDNQRGTIKRATTSINNVSNETLASGGVGKGARTNSSIGGLEEYYPLPHYSYNEDGSILAKIASPGGVNASTGWDSSTNFIDPAQAGGATASTDSAANPTRAIPGELVYTATSKAGSGALAVPKQDDYKAKNG